MKKKFKRIGILTGGGDCPGLNAVIRAVTKKAIIEHDAEIVGFKDGYDGLIKNLYVNLDYHDVSGILTEGGTILGTSNQANPFRHPVKKKGKIEFIDVSDRAVKNFKKHRLDALVCIGGDGTLIIASKLMKKGIPIVGVPKTIDNDVNKTDFTFGFHSAVVVATEAIDRIHTTAQSHHRVMVIELMGRYVGWLALYAGVAGGGDIILIPEIPFKMDNIYQVVEERNRKGKKFSIVVIAEGVKPESGKLIVKKTVETSTDPIRLGGVGHYIANIIEKETGIESRVTVLGHLQRGGTPCAFDRILATRYGTAATEMIARGQFGCMPALVGDELKVVSIDEAVNELKRVPPDHYLIKAARAVGTSFGDR